MITTVLAILGTLTAGALALWGRLAVRRRIRLAYEQGREDMRNDACEHLLHQMEAKVADGDHFTAAALRSAGVYIRNDTMNVLTEALRNQTRERESRAKEERLSA